MSEPVSLQGAFANAAKRFQRIADDDAFWREREALLATQSEQERKDRERIEAEAHALRVASIPARYREPFHPKRSRLAPRVLDAVAGWTEATPLGIGLSGATGMGKTRALCSILLRLRCTWLYLPASKLSMAVADQWSDNYRTASEAAGLLRDARRVRVLMLDDLGDEKHTEAITAELKDLIEHRTSRGLPILWTSNLSPEQITAKHGERGAAIARRLAEFTWTS